MNILVLRTDAQEAEVGVYKDTKQVTYEKWQAHRELAETLNKKIINTLQSAGVLLHQLDGIVVYKGPGSFTGLRIGVTVANALAYGLQVPVVSTTGQDWLEIGVQRLMGDENESVSLPEYGADPHITAPKH